MGELSEEVKAQLHKQIDESDLYGLYETLKTILVDPNPDMYTVEFTRQQGDYLRRRAAVVQMDVETLLRWVVDGMMRAERMTPAEREQINGITKRHARK
jgi:hypothetical protein